MLIMAITDALIIILESLFLGDCIALLKEEKAFTDELKEKYEKAESDNDRQYYKGIIDGRCAPRVIAAMIATLLCGVNFHIIALTICIKLQVI